MTGYPESRIRAACRSGIVSPATEEVLIMALKQGDHAHDWADADEITVKELRDAWRRANAPAEQEQADARLNMFLRDISRHREPDYPVKTTWKDADGAIWRRIPDGKWGRLAQIDISPDDAPKRPLRRMDVL